MERRRSNNSTSSPLKKQGRLSSSGFTHRMSATIPSMKRLRVQELGSSSMASGRNQLRFIWSAFDILPERPLEENIDLSGLRLVPRRRARRWRIPRLYVYL